MKLRAAVILILVSPLFGVAQLVTNTSQTPSALVQNVLLGPGVTVSNIFYNGSPSAIGFFDGSATNLGISSGIVMTTGTVVNNGTGPHGPNNQANSGIDNGTPGSGLLSAQIGGSTTFNATTLEFDFVPYSDTVRFKYVFGSEEYPEFAPPNNSGFNDIFGFFISGPGISGLQNIAQLPGGGGVVSINNVNAITNSFYFINNGDGSQAPQNGSPFYIQYDGFTKVLEAVARVQCGQTYHLILSIADVGDGIYDSGIFLEANSLSSKTPVDITYQVDPENPLDPNLMSEGCTGATIFLERGTNNLSSPLTIPVTVSGTATEGVDFSDIPASVTFNPGQTNIQFSLDAFADAITEGVETINLQFMLTDPCGNQTPVVITLDIQDIMPVSVTIQNPGLICPGDEVILTALPQGGGAPYTYTWSTGETTPTITVAPTTTQTYSVSVSDNCLGTNASASSTVNVPVLQPLVLSTSGNITEICPYIPQTMTVTATGGAGFYNYQWSVVGGANLGAASLQSVAPAQTTVYNVQVTDLCGNVQNAQITYTITSPPLILSISPDAEICPGDSVLLEVTATGGFGQYYYDWPQLGVNTSSVWVSPDRTTTYLVSVSDECQTFTVEASTTVTVIQPTANFYILSTVLFDELPVQFGNASQNASTYEWTFGDGNSSTLVHPTNVYATPGEYVITLVAIDDKGCTDTISKPITIKPAYYVYVPNTFTPDGLRYNNYFSASFFGISSAEVMVFNRWGETVYTSKELDFAWDGTFEGVPVQDGTYTWKITYVTLFGLEETIHGHVNVIR